MSDATPTADARPAAETRMVFTVFPGDTNHYHTLCDPIFNHYTSHMRSR